MISPARWELTRVRTGTIAIQVVADEADRLLQAVFEGNTRFPARGFARQGGVRDKAFGFAVLRALSFLIDFDARMPAG